MKTTAINQQTAGPLSLDPVTGCLYDSQDVVIADTINDQSPYGEKQQDANVALLKSAYNAFDKAARTLGVDAAELAGAIDLAEMVSEIQLARERLDYAQNATHETPAFANGILADVSKSLATLLAKLPKGST